jgi:hypothetical protein
MKLLRMLSRLALVSLAAAVFVGLTDLMEVQCGPPLPNSDWQEEQRHRPDAPDLSKFPEFIAGGMAVVLLTFVGRIFLRLRLSPVSHSEGQLISLDLRGRRQSPKS